jgi:dTDP-4-amino-4,6-dideoxygalactose transaminase
MKLACMNKLAVKKIIPFHVPEITEDEIQAVVEVMREGWVNTGPRVKKFEQRFSDYVGSSNAVAVSSGTAALHVALKAFGIGTGDEVITTPYTFTATAQTVVHCGAKPVLVDVDEDTFNIGPAEIEKHITPKTKAIIPVHVGGCPCDMDAIDEVVGGREIKIIEDAAHALPSSYKGRMIGSIGDSTCFSFYTSKTLYTVEGGMVTFKDDDLVDRAGSLGYHGLSSDAYKRFRIEGSWYYEVGGEGFKYNMPDLLAAIGLVQLGKQDELKERRKKVADAYTAAFSDVPELIVPVEKEGFDTSYHLYLLRIRPETLQISRNEIIEQLKSRGIGTHVHYIPLHLHPYYQDNFGMKPGDFPVAERLYESVISLPIYPSLAIDDVQRITSDVIDIVKNNR